MNIKDIISASNFEPTRPLEEQSFIIMGIDIETSFISKNKIEMISF